MEPLVVGLLILVGIVFNSLPYLISLLATPKEFVFLGTVHHPFDYFYYLSQFAQGKTNWIFSQNLYTSDFPQSTLVGWLNVFLGRLGFLVGLPHTITYQLAVAGATTLLLVVAWEFLKTLFPQERIARLTALALFILNVPFPDWRQNSTQLVPADYWFNFGHPLTRFGGVPHQLIGTTSLLAALVASLRFKTNWFWIATLAVSGLILASVNPVQWLLVTLVVAVNSWLKRGSFYPPVVLAAAGGPMAWYLRQLFAAAPYSQLVSWEAAQPQQLSLLGFLLATGPVLPLATVGLVSFVKNLTPARLLTLLYTITTMVIFLSPLPPLLGLGNVRFSSPVTILGLAAIAGFTLEQLNSSYLGKLATKIIVVPVVLLAVILAKPLLTSRLTLDHTNAYYYLPREIVDFYASASNIAKANETYLLIWPFNVSFPGLTGRRSFNGHPLLTVNAGEKDKLAAAFFDGQMNESEMKQLLTNYSISYVIAYNWTPKLATVPFLTKELEASYLVLYRVGLDMVK